MAMNQRDPNPRSQPMSDRGYERTQRRGGTEAYRDDADDHGRTPRRPVVRPAARHE